MSEQIKNRVLTPAKRPRVSKTQRLKSLVERIVDNHQNNPAIALRHIKEATQLAEFLNDTKSKYEISHSLGRLHARRGDYPEAQKHLTFALEYANALEDNDVLICRCNLTLGAVNFFQEKNEAALKCYFNALATDIDEFKMGLYLNIANIYHVNKNYKKSLQYQKQGLKLAREANDTEHIIYYLSNIGANLFKLNKEAEALEYFEQAINTIETSGGSMYMRCNCLINIGEARRNLKQFEAAEKAYKNAIKIARDQELHLELAKAYCELGVLKQALKQEKSFLSYIYKSRKISEEYGYDSTHLDALRILQQHFEKKGAFDKAYRYLKMITELQTTIQSRKQEKELGQILDDKENQISILEAQKGQIEQQKQILEQKNGELATYNRELEQYAYIVAHDLREPLRNISSFTGLIKKRYLQLLDETGQEYMDFVTINVSRMNNLLTELLKYSSVKRREEVLLEELNMEELVHEVMEALRTRINEKKAVVMIGEMPTIKVHHHHVLLIFQNLIKNALQFNDSDPCEIQVSSKKIKGGYEFVVKDNGIGIEPQYHEKIFKIFNRLDRKEYTGTGIGLTLCQKIVQIYGGKIWLESTLGEGAAFHFTLMEK